MPIAASARRNQYRVPGLYRSLADDAERAAVAVDPRLKHPEFVPKLSDAQRRIANSTCEDDKNAGLSVLKTALR